MMILGTFSINVVVFSPSGRPWTPPPDLLAIQFKYCNKFGAYIHRLHKDHRSIPNRPGNLILHPYPPGRASSGLFSFCAHPCGRNRSPTSSIIHRRKRLSIIGHYINYNNVTIWPDILILPSRASSLRIGSRSAYLIPAHLLNLLRSILPSLLESIHKIRSRCDWDGPSLII